MMLIHDVSLQYTHSFFCGLEIEGLLCDLKQKVSGRRQNNFSQQQQQFQQQAAQNYQQQAAQSYQQQAYQQQYQQQAAYLDYQAKLAEYEIQKRQYAEQVAQAKANEIQATMPIAQVPQPQPQPVPQVQYSIAAQQQQIMQSAQIQRIQPEKTWFQKNGAYLFAFIFLLFAIVCAILCYLETRQYNSTKTNNNLYLIYTFAIGAGIFLLFAIILFLKRSMHSK